MFEINFILFQFYYIRNGWDHKTTLEAAPCLAALLQWAAMGCKGLQGIESSQSVATPPGFAITSAHCDAGSTLQQLAPHCKYRDVLLM